jgi:hypothetical protein
MALVVSQTPVNQKKVADLLATLRLNMEQQLTVETRVVHLSKSLAKQLRGDGHFSHTCNSDEQAGTRVTFLGDEQLTELMAGLSANRWSEVSLEPATTVHNGHEVTVSQRGVDAGIVPMLSADRRFVQLNVKLALAAKKPCETIKFADNLSVVVPVEGTAAFDMGGNKFLFVTARLAPNTANTAAANLEKEFPSTRVLIAWPKTQRENVEKQPLPLGEILRIPR